MDEREWNLEDILSEFRDEEYVADPPGDTEEETPEVPSIIRAEEEVRPMAENEFDMERQSARKRREVIEQFPDTPAPEPQERLPDDFDYGAFFHMFADQDNGASDEDKEEDVSAILSSLSSVLSDLGEEQQPEKPAVAPEEPLMAEDSPDFKAILRDFMMADQHPIYADTPGIGSPPQSRETTEKILKEVASELGREPAEPPTPRKSKKRSYTVKEEFPPEQQETGSDDGAVPPPETVEPGEGEAPTETTESTETQEPSEEKQSPKQGKEKKGLLSGVVDRIGRKGRKSEKSGRKTVQEKSESVSEPDAEEAELLQEEEDDEILYAGDFPSFGQWILNELLNIWIRLNGVAGRESTATMEENSEDLGSEVNVANASRYYGSQITMLRMRFQIGLFLLAVLAYITLGFPVSGMLKTAKVASAMCLGLQLTIMLLCLDVVTNAAVNLTRGRFGADGLAVLGCIISSLDALAVTVGGFGSPHIPLCLFSSMALLGILLSSLLSARALRKSIRVPAIGRRAYCVTAEEGVRNNRDITLLKSVRPTAGFVRRAEEAPPDETLFSKAAVFELAAAVVLSLLTGLVRHSMKDLLYILSALLSCAVPFTALLSFALPFFIGSQRIFSSGAAVAGWSGIHDIGSSRNLIVTDRDLFPEDTITIDTVRIFADESAERVIAYAGSMVAASGSGLGPSFSELMEKNSCRMRQVEDFQWLSGGGLQGRIEGHRVLCGNADLMQLMDVKIPYRLVDRTTVLLAIDGVLYGIFKISYVGLPDVKSALQDLIASNRHPIFAIRDFNITPDMLRETFDVATDGYDFPPYGERFRISEAQPSENSKVAAVVCREGLGPLTHLADTGRSMYVAVRINLMITALTAVVGTLILFVRLIGTGLLSAWVPLAMMLLSGLVVALVSVFMRF